MRLIYNMVASLEHLSRDRSEYTSPASLSPGCNSVILRAGQIYEEFFVATQWGGGGRRPN